MASNNAPLPSPEKPTPQGRCSTIYSKTVDELQQRCIDRGLAIAWDGGLPLKRSELVAEEHMWDMGFPEELKRAARSGVVDLVGATAKQLKEVTAILKISVPSTLKADLVAAILDRLKVPFDSHAPSSPALSATVERPRKRLAQGSPGPSSDLELIPGYAESRPPVNPGSSQLPREGGRPQPGLSELALEFARNVVSIAPEHFSGKMAPARRAQFEGRLKDLEAIFKDQEEKIMRHVAIVQGELSKVDAILIENKQARDNMDSLFREMCDNGV
ncbi:uncharacterized protein GGS22DRAFT_193039 [Annulohypoxylon maeteangense]|uniref:uncharacterized protein n=1 Tax=Annulohypoxylon maeteangense TaxID=1927788 RepID=UPI002008C9A7|nr:uncharacterized protein GGS22DRAFT_193039 [Annulohypoxylon maeteangense]KAI0880663.1 hypothetical protein GGS22DRAFT_193039 [Annulohypoxylon maeteangense]